MSQPKFDGEKRIQEFFCSKGLRVGRFSKAEMRKGKTPDCRVFANDELAFYCEVKTKQEDDWLDRQLASAPPCTLVGGSRPDPTYYRLSAYIQAAVQQLDAVNPIMEHPNVLAIFNGDKQVSRGDLVRVVTGSEYCQSGEVIPMFTEYSEGIIREAKLRVHLYLWFNDWEDGEPKMYYPEVHLKHCALLYQYLGVDQSATKRLPGSPTLR